MPADADRIRRFSTSTAPVALVTGASSGLGTEFARLAAADGFRVILTARRRERLEALAQALEANAARPMLPLPLDLFDLEKAERPAADAALTGWRAMKAGRVVVIDGWANRLLARVVWATPEPLVRLLAGRLLGRLRTEL